MRLVIEPGGVSLNYWRDLWRYRELMYFLAWRDLAVRYKQTAIGVAWALIRPALTMLVFLLFRRLMDVERDAVPDTLLVLSAVLPWQLFANALTESSGSLIANTNLISKVYFPRLLIPVAAVATACADFVITLGMLAVIVAWLSFPITLTLLALPLFIVEVVALSVGLGLLLSALNVKYRDFRYVVPFVMQVGLFVSPIAFSSASMPERWRTVYALNPLVGIIDGFRWSILAGRTPLDPYAVIVSVIVTVATLAAGIWYFRRTERGFADAI